MKKPLVLILIVAATTGLATITAIPPFSTTPILTENYDAVSAGSHTSFPVFAGRGIASRIGTGGALLVGGISGPLSPPNAMFGRGVNVRIQLKLPMTMFGGYFKQADAGIKVTKVKFVFYGTGGSIVGSKVEPLTTAWKWIGFALKPQWSRVDVLGNGTLPGYVMFDNTKIRP